MPDVFPGVHDDTPSRDSDQRGSQSSLSVNITCEACGTSFKRQALLAVLIALGAKTRDPNDCWESDDGEHEWKESMG